jgi:hypothetical protein
MDVFHDSLVLPGSSSAGLQQSNNTTTTTNNTSSTWSVNRSRISPSLMRALRDSYHLIGVKSVESPGSQKQRPEGPQLDDCEWRRQVLQLKISQVCVISHSNERIATDGFKRRRNATRIGSRQPRNWIRSKAETRGKKRRSAMNTILLCSKQDYKSWKRRVSVAMRSACCSSLGRV